jgi:hypothetical protein
MQPAGRLPSYYAVFYSQALTRPGLRFSIVRPRPLSSGSGYSPILEGYCRCLSGGGGRRLHGIEEGSCR